MVGVPTNRLEHSPFVPYLGGFIKIRLHVSSIAKLICEDMELPVGFHVNEVLQRVEGCKFPFKGVRASLKKKMITFS